MSFFGNHQAIPLDAAGVLDFHKQKQGPLERGEIFDIVDKFLYQMSQKYQKKLRLEPIELVIIVGKGINSRRLVGGKHPLRFFVEEYLNLAGYKWRDSVERPELILVTLR